jgi:hypothetical protein
LLVIIDFWNRKIWTGHLTETSQNGKNYIDSHSKFVIMTQYVNVIQDDKFIWEIFSLKTLTV